MICDTLEHLARYKGLHPNLDTAIDYLLTHDLSALPNDRTEVDGDEVFINVMDAALHPDAGYHPEYHKLYADLQIDITGGEGWASPRTASARSSAFSRPIARAWAADRSPRSCSTRRASGCATSATSSAPSRAAAAAADGSIWWP